MSNQTLTNDVDVLTKKFKQLTASRRSLKDKNEEITQLRRQLINALIKTGMSSTEASQEVTRMENEQYEHSGLWQDMQREADKNTKKAQEYDRLKASRFARHSDELPDAYLADIDPETMEYLEHHGILGMKWGIRRYQNPDGTLTALGKKHLEDGKTQAAIDKWNQKKGTAIAKGDKKFFEKHLDYMTNDDIAKFNDRLRARNTVSGLKQEGRKIDAEKIKTWMNTASNITLNASQIAENGVKLYNTIAKLHNTFSKGNKWNLVKEDNNNNDNKNKDNQGKQDRPSIKEVWRNGEKESTYTVSFDKDGRRIEKEEHYKANNNGNNNQKQQNQQQSQPKQEKQEKQSKSPSTGLENYVEKSNKAVKTVHMSAEEENQFINDALKNIRENSWTKSGKYKKDKKNRR